jgi:hypothetical protein
MAAIRVFLYSIVGAGVFAILGSWGHASFFGRLHYQSETPFFVFGVIGALIGAIAAAVQSVVEQLQTSRSSGPRSTQ